MKYPSPSMPIGAIAEHYGLDDRATYELAGMLLEQIHTEFILKSKWLDALSRAFTPEHTAPQRKDIIQEMRDAILQHRGLTQNDK